MSDLCASQNVSLNNAFNLGVSLSGGASQYSTTTVISGLQRKFNLNVQDPTQNYQEVMLNGTNETTFPSTFFDPVQCLCDNILLEAHYTVYYNASSSS